MNIITKDPLISKGEVDKAFMRELKTGLAFERAREGKMIEKARKQAQGHKGKAHPILGECIAVIPARKYFRLTQKYSPEEVASDEFIRRMRKDPDLRDLCPNAI